MARLNRVVAVAEAYGAEAGLKVLAGLKERLPRSYRLAAVRGARLATPG